VRVFLETIGTAMRALSKQASLERPRVDVWMKLGLLLRTSWWSLAAKSGKLNE
jgi:hypothetical protein